ncbi:hypothetical protein F5Y19DRAFT_438507 [Xylariaceae sp. FL1651]|nr:hypothetical protein F5Y19DRAFT_438507 [Xylariaceae sp. FL1651]
MPSPRDFMEPTEPDAQSCSGVAIPETGPAKLSIRASESHNLTANRKDDLENGPLLLELGSRLRADEPAGQLPHDPELAGPISSQVMPLHQQASSASILPLRYGKPLDIPYTEAATSSDTSGGRSYSIPTSGEPPATPSMKTATSSDTSGSKPYTIPTRSTRYSRLVSELNRLLLALRRKPTTLDPTRRLPSADMLGGGMSKGDPALRVEDNLPPLLPWHYEFSWESNSLHFAGEPLKADASLSSPSEGSICVNAPDSDRGHAHASTSVASSTEQCFAGGLRAGSGPELVSEEPVESAYQAGLVRAYRHEFHERVFLLLDDRYWREYRPQRLNDGGDDAQRDSVNKQQPNTTYSNNTVAPNSQLKQRQSKSSQTNGSDNGDNEEDSENDARRRYFTVKRRNGSRRVDCPFYKRNPVDFQECCGAGFTQISLLKTHLRTKHREPYCKDCLWIVLPEYKATHICGPREKEVTFLTEDKLARLQQRADRKKSLQGQWEDIYQIIFPNDKPPFPCPYVRKRTSEINDSLTAFLREARPSLWQEIAQSLTEPSLLKLQEQKTEFESAVERWTAKTLHNYLNSEGVDYNESNLDVGNLQTTKSSEQSQFSEDVSHVKGFGKSTVAVQPALQESFIRNSCTRIGQYEIANETLMNTQHQAVDTIADNFMAGSYTAGSKPGLDYSGTGKFSAVQNTNELPMTFAMAYNPLPQLSGLNACLDRSTEPWYLRSRLYGDGYAQPASLHAGSEPAQFQQDWAIQTNPFLSFDETFPNNCLQMYQETNS